MSTNRELELSISYLEYLKCFIIRTWKNEWSITWECNAFNWRRMTLNHLRWSFNWVVPYSDSLISWAWGNKVTSRRDLDIVNRSLMTNEPVWSQRRFEVPNHDSSIQRWWNHLFQVWVESNCCDCILMTLERSFKRWVAHSCKEFRMLPCSTNLRLERNLREWCVWHGHFWQWTLHFTNLNLNYLSNINNNILIIILNDKLYIQSS